MATPTSFSLTSSSGLYLGLSFTRARDEVETASKDTNKPSMELDKAGFEQSELNETKLTRQRQWSLHESDPEARHWNDW